MVSITKIARNHTTMLGKIRMVTHALRGGQLNEVVSDAVPPPSCPMHRARPVLDQPSTPQSRPIPKAPGLPLIGSMPELMVDPLGHFIKNYVMLGPVFRVVAPTRNYIIMVGTEATRFLLTQGARVFDHAPLYANVAGELGASHYPISTTGERHLNLRRELKRAFAIDVLADATPTMLEQLGRHARELTPGSRHIVLPLVHRLLGNVVIPAVAGSPLGPRLGDAIRFARYSVGTGLGAYPAMFRYAPRYRLSRRRMFAFFGDLVAEHRARAHDPERRLDFVDHVLAVRDEHGAPLTEHNVLALAQMIYSNTLLYVGPAASFLLHALLSNPDALHRCEQELDEAYAHGPPTFDALSRCSYFSAAVKESMRLHPIGFASPRVVTEAFHFDGCHIPAGEAVFVVGAAAHYLPEFYPDPYRFEPQRHLAPRFESRAPGAYAPLGLGLHTCLGARLVHGIVLATVGALIHHCRLSLEPSAISLRMRMNPFPEPTDALAVRVLGHRCSRDVLDDRMPRVSS